MTWTLRSGRVLTVSPDDAGFLDRESNGGLSLDGEPVCIRRKWYAAKFTPSERREIAAAVKACWDRWAETGEA